MATCRHLQESKGYDFESETDTETIAKLVKYMYDNRESDDISFATLVERVTQQLVGSQSDTLTLVLGDGKTNWSTKNVFPPVSGRSLRPGVQKCPLPR